MAMDRQAGKRAGKASAATGALLLLGGCLTSPPNNAASDPTITSDQWLKTADADQVVNAMSAKGFAPATIDCRFEDNTPGQLAYASKFTWRRSPPNTRFHWEVGDPAYLASSEVKANRVGMRRVSAKTVMDAATGQKVGCSIWAG